MSVASLERVLRYALVVVLVVFGSVKIWGGYPPNMEMPSGHTMARPAESMSLLLCCCRVRGSVVCCFSCLQLSVSY